MTENDGAENSGMPQPFGGYKLTNEDRAKGREAAKIVNSGRRFNSFLNQLLHRKANVNVVRARLSEKDQPLFDSMAAHECREADPETGEGSELTWFHTIVINAAMRAHDGDRGFREVADRVDGKPVQAVEVQGRQVLEFVIPPEMIALADAARKKAEGNGGGEVVEADFDVEDGS